MPIQDRQRLILVLGHKQRESLGYVKPVYARIISQNEYESVSPRYLTSQHQTKYRDCGARVLGGQNGKSLVDLAQMYWLRNRNSEIIRIPSRVLTRLV